MGVRGDLIAPVTNLHHWPLPSPDEDYSETHCPLLTSRLYSSELFSLCIYLWTSLCTRFVCMPGSLKYMYNVRRKIPTRAVSLKKDPHKRNSTNDACLQHSYQMSTCHYQSLGTIALLRRPGWRKTVPGIFFLWSNCQIEDKMSFWGKGHLLGHFISLNGWHLEAKCYSIMEQFYFIIFFLVKVL